MSEEGEEEAPPLPAAETATTALFGDGIILLDIGALRARVDIWRSTAPLVRDTCVVREDAISLSHAMQQDTKAEREREKEKTRRIVKKRGRRTRSPCRSSKLFARFEGGEKKSFGSKPIRLHRPTSVEPSNDAAGARTHPCASVKEYSLPVWQ